MDFPIAAITSTFFEIVMYGAIIFHECIFVSSGICAICRGLGSSNDGRDKNCTSEVSATSPVGCIRAAMIVVSEFSYTFFHF